MSLRVFELAKELNIPTKELIKKINNMGIEISGNFSSLSESDTKTIKKGFLEPSTRIEETVVPSREGVKRVRRRIISAKKAVEGKKIKKSLDIEDKPLEKDVETRKKMSETDDTPEVEKEKIPKKVSKKKSGESKEEAQNKTAKKEEVETAVKKEKAEEEEHPGKEEKKADEKKSTKKDVVAETEAKETKKEKVVKAEEITKKTDQKKKKETTEKAAKGSKEKGQKAQGAKKKPVKGEKPDIVPEQENKAEGEFGKKKVLTPPKKEKYKTNKRSYSFDEESSNGFSAGKKAPHKRTEYSGKKRFSKAARRKEKARKKADIQKQKHTFNPRQKELIVGEFISVGNLASLIGIKVSEIIKTLMSLGIMATITQSIDGETAALVASEHKINLKVQFESIEDSIEQDEDDAKNLVLRSPVVTIMGHVDHGKTSLLDKIRKSNVTDDEAGGITQHIGAYHVKTADGRITFLDTPGHEAFTAMRYRGADVTDIVILVVAADDGPRPQTIEAIAHSKAANVEIIVAINKCDKPDANPDRTIQKLMEHELVPEEFGGDIPMIKVSAKSGDGIEKLLEMVHLQAEVMELKANPNRLAEGVVIESKVDKGCGNTATILIQKGTLKIGDNYIVGTEYGRVRAMWNDKGKKISSAEPSIPVEIVGLNGVPKAGDRFNVGNDEKQVRQIAILRTEKEKEKKQAQQQKRTLENIFDSMEKEEKRILNLIIKTDVDGSMDALVDALYRLGNEQVAINVIHGAVGAITSTDVLLASTSDSIIIGFNTRPDPTAKRLAQDENIDIRLYSIIYEVIEDVKDALEGMLKPIIREEIQGKATILEIFNIPKIGIIAGSKVIEGKFVRDCPVRVIRDNVIIHDGKLSSLKRFKDAAKEVLSGFECGIGVEAFKDLRAGDELESYVRLETAAKL